MIRTTHPDSPLQRVIALQGDMGRTIGDAPYTERPDRIRIWRAWEPEHDSDDAGPWCVDGYDSNTGELTEAMSQHDTFAAAINNGIPFIASMYQTFAVELGGDDVTQPNGAEMNDNGYCWASYERAGMRDYAICTRDPHPHSPHHVAGNGDEIVAIWVDTR